MEREKFYEILFEGMRKPGEALPRIEQELQRIIDGEQPPDPERGRLIYHLIEVARSVLRGDYTPIGEFAGHMLKNDITITEAAEAMFWILQKLKEKLSENPEVHDFLDRMAFLFIVILSSEMNELFYRAVQKATGMTDSLFRRLARYHLRGSG